MKALACKLPQVQLHRFEASTFLTSLAEMSSEASSQAPVSQPYGPLIIEIASEAELTPDVNKSIWQQLRGGLSAEHSTKRRTAIVLVSCCLVPLLLVAATVAVAVVVLGGKGNSNDSKGNNDNSSPVLTQRQQFINNTVIAVSDAAILADTYSLQSRAFNWLMFDDALWLNQPEDAVTTEQVLQRYALAVFYFSTGASQILQDRGWLGGDECDEGSWIGVSCDESGHVRTLALGMWIYCCCRHGDCRFPSNIATLLILQTIKV